MPTEIEAKMRLPDRAALEARLAAAGAKRGLVLLEENTFFDNPQGLLKASDRGLRLRIEAEVGTSHQRTLITHKGPRAHGKLKCRMETEVEVTDPAAAVQLLTVLGFAPVLTFQKRRSRWHLGGCHVELDTLPYLGEFVEIEGPSEAAVLAVREKLGLTPLPLIRSSYIAMLVSYLAEHHITTDRVCFEDAEARKKSKVEK